MFNQTTLKPELINIIPALAEFSINSAALTLLDNSYGDLVNDSRTVSEGDIFCAIIGHDQDGRAYISKAINQGAKVVITQCETQAEHGDIYLEENTPVVKFYQLNEHLFRLAKSYYQSPQNAMTLIGITGTNGKTSTSQLIAGMLMANHKRCAVIGTNGAGMLGALTPINNTTPAATDLHQFFNRFSAMQVSHVAMEVSSHALSQKRASADLFDIAVFTNLSRDHLDYHGTMEEYALAKRQLFSANHKQIAVLNYDDTQSKIWLQNWPETQPVWLYARDNSVTQFSYFICAQDISLHIHGVSFTLKTHLGETVINSPLLGYFNIDNLLAAIAVLLIDGTEVNQLNDLVKQLAPIEGRMEAFTNPRSDLPTAVVDYAHTPDALEKALLACREHCTNKLHVVFGCGGDRDKGKRALMAQVAEQYADVIVITNDNPRTEDAQLIANDILAGLSQQDSSNVTVILDREQAVLNTLKIAGEGDIVLLAGKGHEDYIILSDGKGGTQKIMYNERALIANYYQQFNAESNL
ncbi:UDP-N-acetylmuramoyl-L-alanyl-D-glutamate--2,6-diaminopimelate ligase [Colwellia sp. D2M02]|uniref:UDP-N-acetylmuramoyl-L-alanyl-D-glutamate--2, 6-diaminopimelate ligase n=1 Tax=Colwellia sp. D2M02 TaxID=2841562 RepID=UPI001C08F122|nr:UDP-N-acetylmuramoyl-L-alanyl-D-glutamate--2,6-diaminopimelate ligase [Colwellia sp. D2M02]MBU2894842.1 UDP-N-acetylmuramoyl-L-alanyl-D-glutamate--2,6-diaminopimelate ligase [Colwellia sp. D2M02]